MHDLLFRTWPRTGDLGIVPGLDDVPDATYDVDLTEGFAGCVAFPVGTFGSLDAAVAAVREARTGDSYGPDGLSCYSGGYYKMEHVDERTTVVDFGDPFVFGRIVRSEKLYTEYLF